MKAIIALEDGRIFAGRAFGALGEACGEVVFNTSLYGYQEILSDPSYAGQIVVMTCPHVGNYGANPEDEEARRPFLEALVAREISPVRSSWRSRETLDEYLKRHGVVAVSDVDTRALVRHIRSRGVLRGIVSSADLDERRLVERARRLPSMLGADLSSKVSCRTAYHRSGIQPSEGESLRVVAFDYGIKRTILENLRRTGCDVTVVPAWTTAAEALALKPHGVFLSNGPGDPAALGYAVETVRNLLGRVPVFGICLGHQIMGLALGGTTFKLKFGHHGGNQPVRNLLTGQVEITAQNHGFAVDPDSINAASIELTHVNLNDGTLEGFRHRSMAAFSVQYHPEASPGPHDSHYLFGEFRNLMKEHYGKTCRGAMISKRSSSSVPARS